MAEVMQMEAPAEEEEEAGRPKKTTKMTKVYLRARIQRLLF